MLMINFDFLNYWPSATVLTPLLSSILKDMPPGARGDRTGWRVSARPPPMVSFTGFLATRRVAATRGRQLPQHEEEVSRPLQNQRGDADGRRAH